MAASQRDISVSEFFAKNRHLLGFDNPRKALLTTVKEAVDNALDACEEAGILPEVWVHIRQTGENRFQVGVQDNGPGILKQQIPNVFGKLLYGSKFHRLRMSRGQQGIGISAAGMYGLLTTGKPVKIMSKVSPKKPAHYYEIAINTKVNRPEILNGKGEGVDVPPGAAGQTAMEKHAIEWVESDHGTRVTIELEARYQRGRGSVDEYLAQTCIANPHVRLHYVDPEDNATEYERSTDELPPEAKEIMPHPYGIELGQLVTMLKDSKPMSLSQFLSSSFSRVSSSTAKRICETAKLSTRANVHRVGRHEAESLYKALQETRIPPPSTDCIVPIGEQRLLKGLHQVVPGDFYVAVTRPPAVYRGNPFVIEAALAYGGAPSAARVSLEQLTDFVQESDARTLRQFLATTFQGIGMEGANKIVKESGLGTRQTPSKLKPKEILKLHEALQSVNLEEGQTMNVQRFANRVPLQFQQGACAITQTVVGTSWRAYGLTQSRNSLPSGPVTIMVHMASVWVPFTSESKEAIAGYPEIQRELRLALQAIGRKLGLYMRRKLKVRDAGARRNTFLKYLNEIAEAVTVIKDYPDSRTKQLYDQLCAVAKVKTLHADLSVDKQGNFVEGEDEQDFGDNVLIIDREAGAAAAGAAPGATDGAENEAVGPASKRSKSKAKSSAKKRG
ncbi:MAG: DNA topoisomerase VI subunit B [Pirellulales bacterium]|nr:DNA topoisomerase VI subunit B [Pirellulales bacterium]